MLKAGGALCGLGARKSWGFHQLVGVFPEVVGSGILQHQACYPLLAWGPDLQKEEQMLGFS